MESNPQLDAAGRSATGALIAYFLLAFCAAACGQSLRTFGGTVPGISVAPRQQTSAPADRALKRGLTLARHGKLVQAGREFKAASLLYPRDARFPTEIAGIAYRQHRYRLAIKELRHALSLNPRDEYATDFLASIYFLEGNLEAALKYWNRTGKPVLNDLTFSLRPGLNPLLLDRAFSFSRGSEWRLDQFLTTETRLEHLNLFPQMRFDLTPLQNGMFDLKFSANERRRGMGVSIQNFASMLRGLPYQAVYPQFYNLNGNGLNWRSFLRWDDEKRRISSEIAAPLPEGPQKRVQVSLDVRNENWNISRTLNPAAEHPAGLNLERAALGAGIQSLPSWRLQWQLGAEYSYRRFRTLFGIPVSASPFFTNTPAIALRPAVQYVLVRVPERRFSIDSAASAEFGKFFSNPLGRYGRVQGSVSADWLPRAQGDEYELRTMFRAGRTFGQVPFDDLFMLGFDRDNNLWMRGHNGLVNGKKGNAPLGRNFLLSNSDIDKVVYHNPFATVKLGPFLDSGDIYDPSPLFGSRKWLTDTGIQGSAEVLGSFSFIVGYGRDLRFGDNTLYTAVSGWPFKGTNLAPGLH